MNNLDELLKKTLETLKATIDTETVIGKPIQTNDGSVIIPVSKVSYGFVVGGGEYSDTPPKRDINAFPYAGVSGGGITVTPIGFVVCGREKRFMSAEKGSDANNKWWELAKATFNAIKKEDE